MLGVFYVFVWRAKHLKSESAVESDVEEPFEGGEGSQVEPTAPVHGVKQLKDVHHQRPQKHRSKLGMMFLQEWSEVLRCKGFDFFREKADGWQDDPKDWQADEAGEGDVTEESHRNLSR